MVVRSIKTIPASVLQKKSQRVTEFNSELHILIDDMVETMRAAPGSGLSAPQVGVSLRVIVVEYIESDDEDAIPELYEVVNPKLTGLSRKQVKGIEGCLSVPGLMGEVERSEKATVKGFDRNGKPIRIKAKGWLARIFQHEIDHLDGTLFIDHADQVWDIEEDKAQIAESDLHSL